MLGRFRELKLQLLVDALENARHCAHQGRAHFRKVGFDMGDRAGEGHGGPVREGDVVCDRALKRMRERKERKVDVVGRDLNASGNLLHVCNQIGVGQHDALRPSGGAGGVDEACEAFGLRSLGQGVVGNAVPAGEPGFKTRHAHAVLFLVSEVVDEDDLHEVGKLPGNGMNGVPARSRSRHENAASRIAEDVGGGPRRIDRVKRNRHEACRERRLIEGHGVDGIREEHCRPVSRAQSRRMKGAPPAHHGLAEFAPGDGNPAVFRVVELTEGFALRHLPHGAREVLWDGDGAPRRKISIKHFLCGQAFFFGAMASYMASILSP